MRSLDRLKTTVKAEREENITVEKIEKRKGNLSKIVATGLLLGATSAFADGYADWASSDDSFGDLLGTFISWLTGNLGKTIALLGFVGTFVIYLFTHKGSVLFIGVLISLIAGGLVGIVATFFNFGSSAFQIHASNN
jgi:type IV secretory pathway VirB2 component (pilin)